MTHHVALVKKLQRSACQRRSRAAAARRHARARARDARPACPGRSRHARSAPPHGLPRALDAGVGARASAIARDARRHTPSGRAGRGRRLEQLGIVRRAGAGPVRCPAKPVRYTTFGLDGYRRALAVFTELERERGASTSSFLACLTRISNEMRSRLLTDIGKMRKLYTVQVQYSMQQSKRAGPPARACTSPRSRSRGRRRLRRPSVRDAVSTRMPHGRCALPQPDNRGHEWAPRVPARTRLQDSCVRRLLPCSSLWLSGKGCRPGGLRRFWVWLRTSLLVTGGSRC